MVEFLSNPTLADIVSYVIVIFMFIYNVFIKKFVKKDNFLTSTMINNQLSLVMKSVDEKEKKWNEEKEKMINSFQEQKDLWEKERIEMIKEREAWQTEKNQWIEVWKAEKEEVMDIQEEQAEALTIIAGNQAELVKKGVANKVAKMMNKDGGNE